jgi:ribosomal protein S18 acetylase RimI-like enzyme
MAIENKLEQQSTPQVFTPSTPEHLDALRLIFREYADSLPISLDFQGFDEELENLPGDYVEPRGCVLIAIVEGNTAGCVALRPLDNVDYPNACEMKRLYVRPNFRRLGLGRLLTEYILDAATMAGYSTVLLDTLNDMEAARELYTDLGFEEIPPFYHSSLAGAHYLKVELD